MTISKIKANGIEIRIQEFKNEGKETIVFLHYGGATLGIWNGVIPHFKENYNLIAQDLRCHGFTDKPLVACHIDDMAKDLVGILDLLNVEKAHLVGSSMGADVAISFAAFYPDRVISLVLDGGLYDIAGPDSKEQTLTKEAIEKARNDLKERILARPRKYYDSKEGYMAENKEGWEKHFPWSDVVRIATEDEIMETEDGRFTSTQSPEEIWSYIEPLYDVTFADYYKKFKCPILWLPDEKEQDNEIVLRNLENYAKDKKYTKKVTLKGSVHAYTCVLKPEEFSNEISKFYEEIKGL
ncbi:MAG: alpha/beta fold hydrolase [Candidatus Heimdallarchaeota archaeon]